jgi:hypothetical protein
MAKKLTFEEAKEKLESKFLDIELVEYSGWNKQSVFRWRETGKTFTAMPANIFKRGRDKESLDTSESNVKKLFEEKRKDIRLVEYNGWSSESKFYDIVENQYWFAKTIYVYRNNGRSPSRSKREQIEKLSSVKTFKFFDALEKFKQQGRKDIEICEDGYNGWCKKSKFYDLIVGDFWWARPEKVYFEKSSHPKRHGKNTKYIIKESGETIFNWLKFNSNVPYSSLQQHLNRRNITSIAEEDLENVCSQLKSNKTELEKYCEELFGCQHFNKCIPEIKGSSRPDFKLNETTYLNCDGIYWHSELFRKHNDHYNLRKEFEKNSLRLFQFHEHEIYHKSNIVKSIVNHVLGKTYMKVFARKCKVIKISQETASQFLLQNHLMGSINAKHLGLFDSTNKLVAVMSYKTKQRVIKIERWCCLTDTTVVGGFSKLLAEIEKLHPDITEVHNWVDLRYGTGTHLLNKGFVMSRETLGWKWTNFKTTYNRLYCRANMDTRKLTQKDHAKELGLYKIYDAGQRLYIKTL